MMSTFRFSLIGAFAAAIGLVAMPAHAETPLVVEGRFLIDDSVSAYDAARCASAYAGMRTLVLEDRMTLRVALNEASVASYLGDASRFWTSVEEFLVERDDVSAKRLEFIRADYDRFVKGFQYPNFDAGDRFLNLQADARRCSRRIKDMQEAHS